MVRFSTHYGFQKPNDIHALNLMNAAASAVMNELPDITVAYGISDEYRLEKIMSGALRGTVFLLRFARIALSSIDHASSSTDARGA